MENNNFISSVHFVFYDKKSVYNCFQTIMDRSVRKVAPTLAINPLPLINVAFSTKQNGDFSSNIEYGGGGPQQHGISQKVQLVVRIMELGVK